MRIENIAVEAIHPHARNVRRSLGDLSELTSSVKASGIMQPITVAPRLDGPNSQYVVVAGHRRLAAAKAAGMPAVPCIVRSDLAREVDQIEMMLVENLQRADLTVMEEATAYEQLQLLGVKPAAIAKATGRSARTVSSRLSLMRLPEQARDRIDASQLSLADAEYAAKFADDAEIMEVVAEARPGMEKWLIQRVLARRAREAAEAEQRAQRADEADDEDGDDLESDAGSAERRAFQEQREREAAERARLADIAAASDARRLEWIAEQVASGSTGFRDGVAHMAASFAVEDYSEGLDEARKAFGLPLCGEDDDVDDHLLLEAQAVKAWPASTAAVFALLVTFDAFGSSRWTRERVLPALAEWCGYPITEEERELIGDRP